MKFQRIARVLRSPPQRFWQQFPPHADAQDRFAFNENFEHDLVTNLTQGDQLQFGCLD